MQLFAAVCANVNYYYLIIFCANKKKNQGGMHNFLIFKGFFREISS